MVDEAVLLLFQFGERVQNLLRVNRGIDLGPDLDDFAVRIDEECVALGHGNDVVALGKLQTE